MPIDINEWRKGREKNTWKSEVEKFLESNRGKAFYASEIQLAVFHSLPTDITDSTVIRDILEKLVEEGRVQVNLVEKRYGKSENSYIIC